MGNTFCGISIDAKLIEYNLLDKLVTVQEKVDTRFISNFKLWHVGYDEGGEIGVSAVAIEHFTRFNQNDCYILLHLHGKYKTNRYSKFYNRENETPDTMEEGNREKKKLSKLCSSLTKEIGPDGLKDRFSMNTLSEYYGAPSVNYAVYLFYGQKAPGSIQAYTLNAGVEIERWLIQNENELDSVFECGEKVSLAEIYQNDVKGELEKELCTKVHFYRFLRNKLSSESLSMSTMLAIAKKIPMVDGRKNPFLELERKWLGNMLNKQPSDESLKQHRLAEREGKEGSEEGGGYSSEIGDRFAQFVDFQSGSELVGYYRKIASPITPTMYLGSDYVAKNKAILQKNGISHIVNAASVFCKNYHPKSFEYIDFPLMDDGRQGILGFILRSVDFISGAERIGGKVFVHCVQGVSRSNAIVIAYEMWKRKEKANDVMDLVKRLRKCSSPNAGFIVQLYQWEELLANHLERAFLFRIVPLSRNYRKCLIPKFCYVKKVDTRTSFILLAPKQIFLWVGLECEEECIVAAREYAELMNVLVKKGGGEVDIVQIVEGEETPRFQKVFSSVVEKELVASESGYKDIDMLKKKGRANSSVSSHLGGTAKKGKEVEKVFTMVEGLKKSNPVTRNDPIEMEDIVDKEEIIDDGEGEGEYEEGEGEYEGEYESDGESDDDDDYTAYEGAELFLYPLFEPISQFDSDDIYDNPRKVFILRPREPTEYIYVWVGCDVDTDGKELLEFGVEKGKEYLEHAKMDKDIEVRVTHDDDTEYFDQFFKYFLNG